MEEQLIQTSFDPRIPALLGAIKNVARRDKDSYHNANAYLARLEQDLEGLIRDEFEDVAAIRQRIVDDLLLNDYILEDLGTTLARRLIHGKGRQTGNWVRQYNVITKCPACANSNRDRIRESSKGVQAVPVDSYVREAHLQDGTSLHYLCEAGFVPVCAQKKCGTLLEITNASNLIIPKEQQIVHFIAHRVKSAGRYCQKLVDLIFYDKDDPSMRKRSILDRYAFALVLNTPNGISEKKYRRMFKEHYGTALPFNMPIEDAVCYAMLQILAREFETDSSRLQNNIARPKMREREGRIESYKMLQFPLNYHGKVFEGQIKTLDTFMREQDRKSAIGHVNYVEVEEGLRQEMFKRMPEARVVYNVLMKIFGNNHAES
ncbi:hypothetical protein JW898_05195 [Candidatus Woesearchaeota archaeon]|nr:hypothetical protein [Candidatus Woesearchaeota archaeon]